MAQFVFKIKKQTTCKGYQLHRQVFRVKISCHILFHALFDQMQLTLIAICFVEEKKKYIEKYKHTQQRR